MLLDGSSEGWNYDYKMSIRLNGTHWKTAHKSEKVLAALAVLIGHWWFAVQEGSLASPRATGKGTGKCQRSLSWAYLSRQRCLEPK